MLWNASAIRGYAIEATDGHIGHADDFLFSEADWSIQSVVVQTGGWLKRPCRDAARRSTRRAGTSPAACSPCG